MFLNRMDLLKHNPRQKSYGMAVTDVDGDGQFEIVVAGFGFRNMILKWQAPQGYVDIADDALADANRQAIGVAACDLDCDGLEEIYILNTDTFGGIKRLGDRLFDFSEGQWVDLFSVPTYRNLTNMIAGRSVACVDRHGNGRYGFFVANYGGPSCLYEMDEDGRLHNVAEEAGVALIAGGRSVISLPLVSDRMDIFVGNEMGANFLFQNRGDGTFEEIGTWVGVADESESVRGVAAVDNPYGGFDLIYGNWEGPHRLYSKRPRGRFENTISLDMSRPSRVRTVIAADFDNDGNMEIFFNNIGQANRLFGWRENNWVALNIGDAAEPTGLGTGAAVADLDGDGMLELFIAHGESGMQPMTLYHVPFNDNNWLRVLPLTAYGAPARGAVVTIQTDKGIQKRAIDAGSGYLCQMEPIAHFGLGQESTVKQITVVFPDGKRYSLEDSIPANQLLRIEHPDTIQW